MTDDATGLATVRLGAIVDRLTTEEGTAVLVEVPGGHRVARLSELGGTVLDLLAEAGAPVDLDTITAALVERFGPPDGMPARTAVAALLAVLVEEHVLVAES
jgi:hypothetical protein